MAQARHLSVHKPTFKFSMKFIFPLAIFLGSFLLFIIQPMLAKTMLPFVGGAPAVWLSSMLFFQTLLLAGYGYASITSAYLSVKKQSFLHIALIIIAAISLPITLNISEISTLDYPEYWVFPTLLSTIGLPYILLSANAALLQRWYYEIKKTSPYFLFSLSNAGSLIGLLSYPFIVEWLLPTAQQMLYWSGLFIILAVLLTFTATRLPTSLAVKNLGKRLTSSNIVSVVFYGFIPSALFLSTTLFITTDIASVPLLWVIPLALYLLSFIIAFSNRGGAFIQLATRLHVPICALVFLIATYVYAYVSHFYANNYHGLQISINLICLFIVSLSCHGKLANEKPNPEYLTSYYFWLALGGALGGLFSVASPYLFNDIYEYPLILLLSLAAPISLWLRQPHSRTIFHKFILTSSLLAMTTSMIVTWTESDDVPAQYKERNFFGVKKIIDRPAPFLRRELHAGSTLQGHQPTFSGHELHVNANLKTLIRSTPKHFFDKPFGVIGLGTGMLACTAQANQKIDFFEIDPLVIELAKNPEYFTYLKDCAGEPHITLGDGRIEIEKMADEKYSLIVLDAFNSNAIPTHLLTKEAIEIYLKKLDKTHGLLAFNMITRHVDLRDVLAKIGDENNVYTYYKHFPYNPESLYDGSADWTVSYTHLTLPTICSV